VETGLVPYEVNVTALRPAYVRWTWVPARELQGFPQEFRAEAAMVNLVDYPMDQGTPVEA